MLIASFQWHLNQDKRWKNMCPLESLRGLYINSRSLSDYNNRIKNSFKGIFKIKNQILWKLRIVNFYTVPRIKIYLVEARSFVAAGTHSKTWKTKSLTSIRKKCTGIFIFKVSKPFSNSIANWRKLIVKRFIEKKERFIEEVNCKLGKHKL